MPHQMRYSVLTVALACVVLFRITPAVAWPWMERLRGTMWSFSQVVRLGTIDVPKADQGSREHSASAMAPSSYAIFSMNDALPRIGHSG